LDVPADLPGPLVDDAGALLDAVASGLAGGRVGRSRSDTPGGVDDAVARVMVWARDWVDLPENGGPNACADDLARLILRELATAEAHKPSGSIDGGLQQVPESEDRMDPGPPGEDQ
jgi:hypothetical protein